MLSKHVGAVKSVLKKWFKINDIQLVHLLVVWWLVNTNIGLELGKKKIGICFLITKFRRNMWSDWISVNKCCKIGF